MNNNYKSKVIVAMIRAKKKKKEKESSNTLIMLVCIIYNMHDKPTQSDLIKAVRQYIE